MWMASQAQRNGRRHRDHVVALTRLFIEAVNARDLEATRALVSDDVEFRGSRGSSLRGHAAVGEVLETVAHFDLLLVRVGVEQLEEHEDVTRVTVPVREIVGKDELFRTAAFEICHGAISSYETLPNE